MTLNKNYLLPRILIGLMGLVMLAATIPAYGNPTSNPGLINLVDPALSLGETAGAFLGRQLTVILIALIGAATPCTFWSSRPSTGPSDPTRA